VILGSQSESRLNDDSAVRGLYDELIEGWNQGSGAHFAAVFVEDGILIGFDGTYMRGRSVIERFHQALFDKWLKGTRLTGTVSEVRFLGPDIAIMHAVGGTIGRRKTKPAPARDSIQTLVAVRTGENWRLVAFHNTRIRPIGSGLRAFLHWSIGDALWSLLRPSTDPAASLKGQD
jgi:uncharacterized protein (TIGR02246 family)